MRTHRSLALFVLCLAAAGCSGPVFFAEFEDAKVCVTVPRVQVTGVPIGGISADLPSTELDVAKAIPYLDTAPDAWTGSLAVTSINVCSGAFGDVRCGGTADLTGVNSASITLARPNGGAQVLALDYQSPPAVTTPYTLDFAPPADNPNLLDVVKQTAGKLQLSGHFDGSPPVSDWEADVEVCVQTKMTIDLLKIPR